MAQSVGCDDKPLSGGRPEVFVKWGVGLEGRAGGDESDSREASMGLGESRFAAVQDFLVLQGVQSQRTQPISYGEDRPVARL